MLTKGFALTITVPTVTSGVLFESTASSKLGSRLETSSTVRPFPAKDSSVALAAIFDGSRPDGASRMRSGTRVGK